MEFDEILSNASSYFSASAQRVQDNDKYMQVLEHEEMMQLGQLNEQKAAQYVRQREREMLGLDKIVARSGFIRFDDYVPKLRMMDHPLFLFGLKLYDMPGAVEFFDADFCNTLVVKSDQFENKSLKEVAGMINAYLISKGFRGQSLEVG